MAYLPLALAGAFLCNALPHLISGVRGEAFYTPWARPRGVGKSSALQNFLWGSVNLAVAGILGTQAAVQEVSSALVAVGAGFVVAGVGLSILFARRNAAGGPAT